VLLNIIGPPGAGKGTQAKFIESQFGIKQVSTGDLLRQSISQGDTFGKQIDQYVKAGDLVPDTLIIAILQAHLDQLKHHHGILLDGFPRNVSQAKALEQQNLQFDTVFYLEVDNQILIDRLSNRLTHLASGRIYHPVNNPPKVAGIDDITGDKLVKRADDNIASVQNRLKVYQQQTAPLIEYFQDKANAEPNLSFIAIDGNAPIDAISRQLATHLS